MCNITELRPVQSSPRHPRRVFYIYNLAGIVHDSIIHRFSLEAKSQKSPLRHNTIPAAPWQLAAEVCSAHLPGDIGLQHRILLVAPAPPFRFGPAAWWACESQALRLPPNGLVVAARELRLQVLHRRRGIMLPEP